ncbi:dTDP-4-dehydrorhamnose 3,5-epimerase [Priestia taiwanensis]|uniref:dTDP-4-dehydrorhamnose 3,5-epimerase n=1 Tax=Priestia taiwanensis TaxID=1347902 RepID=A0A917ASC7_9BACI|nr:dTDP-4-dehydrorhamnose 3,5-epimerase [Priestia taiwanensis]MBM7364121.1 dTDP-4-dehydrorhamnose 3,5-epimerase [Priestia taiwanensis]GGE71740.1 dTDP-4-dehydrorhamnose 3,5-epimerase [Priestia taiwanensis]
MKVNHTLFDDVKLIDPTVHSDHRGFFKEQYNEQTIRKVGITCTFVQDNVSFSKEAGTLRGLHFQREPKAQAKLVSVLAGAIYDVIVDLRHESPTFKRWQGYVLSEHNHRQLFVPRGFAHGFCTLVPNTIVMYKVDEYYSKEHDSGIYWNDKDLQISWPVSVPILSAKDQQLPLSAHTDANFNDGDGAK